MTTSIRINGAAGILTAIPALLGFHPADSIVLVCMKSNGSALIVGPVARVDLETPITVALADHLADLANRHADAAALAVYSDQPVDTSTLTSAFQGRCRVAAVIHSGNAPVTVPDALTAPLALTGRAVLTRRDDLANSIEPHTTVTPAEQQIHRTMTGVASRDSWILENLNEPTAVPALVAASQAAQDSTPGAANLCAALAAISYRQGNGALAQVAVDRALRIDTGHRLAQLMLAVMAAGLPPNDFAEQCAAISTT